MSEEKNKSNAPLSRRNFIQLSTLAGATIPAIAVSARGQETERDLAVGLHELNEATIADLLRAMARRQLTSVELVDFYLARIASFDQQKVNSVLEVNSEARSIARARDMQRRTGVPLGPLHGIPILLKDNIDTADRTMTTAGSLALVGSAPSQDATVAQKLRLAGAVLLGKANLSEWANFRGFGSSSGWSGRGGQTHNPYALDRNPCGSSSGSAAAASANFCAAALSTETDGSIVCPATANGVVGLKPTLGLTSRAGVVPIAHSQDTVGIHARTVADTAIVLGALTGPDPRDPATQASAGKFFTNYTQFLDPGGLRGARIGVARKAYFGYSRHTDAVAEDAIQAMKDAGAVVIDPADIPTAEELNTNFLPELVVLLYEFKRDLNAYLATRTGVPVRTLAEAIAFNAAHADQELRFFGQELFELAEADVFSQQDYMDALTRNHMLSRQQGIDAIMDQHQLDAIVAPTGTPAWTTDLINGDLFLGSSSSPAALAGYPLISVPAGFVFGLPVGITFMGRAFSEPKLIKLAYAFEQSTRVRRQPQFLSTLPLEGPSSGVIASSAVAAVSEARLARDNEAAMASLNVRLRQVRGL